MISYTAKHLPSTMSIATRPQLRGTYRSLVLLSRVQPSSTSAAAAPTKTHDGGGTGGGEHKIPDPEFVNAPLSTLPAALELPHRGPGDSMFPHVIKTGKAYVCPLFLPSSPCVCKKLKVGND